MGGRHKSFVDMIAKSIDIAKIGIQSYALLMTLILIVEGEE